MVRLAGGGRLTECLGLCASVALCAAAARHCTAVRGLRLPQAAVPLARRPACRPRCRPSLPQRGLLRHPAQRPEPPKAALGGGRPRGACVLPVPGVGWKGWHMQQRVRCAAWC
eukprot:359189-Chlamydomonas_euryale.AAC.7